MNNDSLPELKAFKRAPCPVPSLGLPNSGFSLRIHLNKNHENIEI